jgi:hypothetical protein
MSKSAEGVYRDGKIELTEPPSSVPEGTRVVVTFPGTIYDLRKRGLDETLAADPRARLGAFAESGIVPKWTSTTTMMR